MSISVTNTKSPITVVDDKVTIKVSSGIGPQGTAGAGGVTTLNSLAGAVTLAVVGGTIAAAGNTLTITVSAGVSSWGDLTGKPFTTLGTGLVVVAGVLSATGLAISDTTGLQAALDAKAPLASPTFTGTVSGVTKTMVGLSAVDNVADASKPVSTAQAAADAAVQAHAIQRANHTGTQGVGTITGLGSLATQSGTFSGISSGTNTGDQTATTVSVAGGYGAFSPAALNVESTINAISGALENKADSSPATTENLGPIRVGAGLGIASGTLSVTYGTGGAQKVITSGSAAPSGGVSGDFYFQTSAAGQVTPATLTASTDDYSPGAGDIYRLSSSAAFNLTGWAAWTDGTLKMLVNVGSFNITLKHQSTNSSDGNRFITPWAGDFVVPPGGSATLYRDATDSRVRVF